MSKPAQALRCGRCGMALPPDCAGCPQCGQPVMLRSDSGVPAWGDGARAPAARREPKRPAARATLPLHTRVSAALPRRLTAADPNGARSWSLSTSAAVILFGFVIGFGTYVAMSEHESAQERWRTVEAARHADEARAAAAHNGEHDEARDSPSSTLTSPSSNSLVALLQQQIDSARTDDASDAAQAKGVNDPSPQHGRMPRNAPRAASPGTSLASSDSVSRPARTKGLPQAQAEGQVARLSLPQKTVQKTPQRSPQPLAAEERSGQEPAKKVQAPEAVSTFEAPVPDQPKPTAHTGAPARTTASMQVPTSAQTSAPARTPARTPAQTSAQTSAQTPAQTPAQTSERTPAQTSERTPAQTPARTPAQTPAQTSTPIAAAETAPAQAQPPAPAHPPTDEQPFTSQLAQAPATAPGPTMPPGMLPAPLSAPAPEHEQATARQQPETHAAPAPARCGMEGDAAPCKATSPAVDSHSDSHVDSHADSHGADQTRKARTGSVIRNVQDTLPSRAAAPKHSTRTRPVEHVASVPPRHAPRRTHPRPQVETAQHGRQTDVPLFGQLRHLWRFEMPLAERHTDLSQPELDLYRRR